MSDTNNEVGMNFPETWEEYEQYYGFNDTDEVYTNNCRLIQSYRVKQWLEHLKTEPKKMGKWLKVDDEEPIAYDCSECGAMVSRRCRFCPDCGTKMSNIPTGSNCTDCVLDGTDACSRGAGRAVDGRACEDFVGESED